MSRYIPLILFTVLTNAAAQIMLKRGMMGVGPVMADTKSLILTALAILFNPLVMLALFTYIVSMLSHVIVLSHVEVSFAYPFISLAFVVVAIYAYFVFGEDLNSARIFGIGLICLGTIFVSHS